VSGDGWSIVALVTDGALFWIVVAPDVDGADEAVPSDAVTRTVIASPLSPFPAVARFSVAPVAP
jgi:hypothetical protein